MNGGSSRPRYFLPCTSSLISYVDLYAKGRGAQRLIVIAIATVVAKCLSLSQLDAAKCKDQVLIQKETERRSRHRCSSIHKSCASYTNGSFNKSSQPCTSRAAKNHAKFLTTLTRFDSSTSRLRSKLLSPHCNASRSSTAAIIGTSTFLSVN